MYILAVILFGAGCGKKEKPARERTGGWGEELSSRHYYRSLLCRKKPGQIRQMEDCEVIMQEQKNTVTSANGDSVICPHCGAKVPKGNFCCVCTNKMVEICDCVVKRKLYKCGHEKCPGVHLIVDEIKKKAKILKNKKNSDGNDIGLCVNCEHAQLDITEDTCASCSSSEELFKNFVKASDKQESIMCGTCRNNPKLPKQGTPISADNQGLPCRVCTNDYFYHPVVD